MQIWGVRPGQLGVNRPLELVQIDHTLVDIIVLSPDPTKKFGRPWRWRSTSRRVASLAFTYLWTLPLRFQ
jgi:hypothetical protein